MTLSGIIELLHVTPETVEIIDYKTDRGRHAEPEYRKQLSVYFHVLAEVYPDRDVRPVIFYTESGSRLTVDPVSRSELRELVAAGGRSNG